MDTPAPRRWCSPCAAVTAIIWLAITVFVSVVGSNEGALFPLMLVSLLTPAVLAWRVYACWLAPRHEGTADFLHSVAYAALPGFFGALLVKVLLSLVVALITVGPALYAAAQQADASGQASPAGVPAAAMIAYVLLGSVVAAVVDEPAKAAVVRARCCERVAPTRGGSVPSLTAAAFVAAAVGFAVAESFFLLIGVLALRPSPGYLMLVVLPAAALGALVQTEAALLTALRLAISDAQLVARAAAWSWPRVLWPALALRAAIALVDASLRLALSPNGALVRPAGAAPSGGGAGSSEEDALLSAAEGLDASISTSAVATLVTTAIVAAVSVILARQWAVVIPTVAAGGPPPALACVGPAAERIVCLPGCIPCCDPAQPPAAGVPAYDAPAVGGADEELGVEASGGGMSAAPRPSAAPFVIDDDDANPAAASQRAAVAAEERVPLARP